MNVLGKIDTTYQSNLLEHRESNNEGCPGKLLFIILKFLQGTENEIKTIWTSPWNTTM